MRVSSYFLMCSLIGLCLAGTASAAPDNASFVVEEQGRGTWRAVFDKKMDTSAEQWEYALATQKRGQLRKAERRMLYLVRRWPNSKEAPWGARARADILFSRNKLDDAFEAYQYLIDNYSSRMADYDSVLQSQFEIATRIMTRRHMVWAFGGYQAPEHAVEYYESVIRNGPQWSRADEAQYMIGKCHQDADEFELAISAYGLLGYRYPDSRFAEEAAWQQIRCLKALHQEYPNSPEMLERMLTATTVFLSAYPASDRKSEIIELRNSLYEVKAGAMFDKAAFYARDKKNLKAAILYEKALLEEYPKSSLVPMAQERLEVHEALLAQPKEEKAPAAPRAKPLPFG